MENRISWNGQMSFTGITPSGHQIKMDAAPESGGTNSGPRPTELLLNAAAGCTAIDIISILQKMRLNPNSLQVVIDGERAKEYPQVFTSIHIHYILEGELPEEKVARAIQLSKETYCSVSNSLNGRVTATYEINGRLGDREL
ncbi:OsmC family protein [Peribacillus sp. SCS-37]|uniref:OsmC family protein n=1 Tax=Paraperibacillus esterisolvens TaxID=3115296 RepID=UPI00390693C8